MVRIAWASVWMKISLPIPTFQDLEVESISWKALMGNCLYSSTLGWGLKLAIHGTHWSIHISIDFPSPSKKHAPFSIRFLPASIALQVGQANLTGSSVIQLLLTLYLVRKTSMQKLCFPETTIHASLASNAELTSFAFLKPSPPCLLGRHNLSQAFHAINLLSLSLSSHQNLLESVSSLPQFLAGTLNEDSVQLGMACATELIRGHLPA